MVIYSRGNIRGVSLFSLFSFERENLIVSCCYPRLSTVLFIFKKGAGESAPFSLNVFHLLPWKRGICLGFVKLSTLITQSLHNFLEPMLFCWFLSGCQSSRHRKWTRPLVLISPSIWFYKSVSFRLEISGEDKKPNRTKCALSFVLVLLRKNEAMK